MLISNLAIIAVNVFTTNIGSGDNYQYANNVNITMRCQVEYELQQLIPIGNGLNVDTRLNGYHIFDLNMYLSVKYNNSEDYSIEVTSVNTTLGNFYGQNRNNGNQYEDFDNLGLRTDYTGNMKYDFTYIPNDFEDLTNFRIGCYNLTVSGYDTLIQYYVSNGVDISDICNGFYYFDNEPLFSDFGYNSNIMGVENNGFTLNSQQVEFIKKQVFSNSYASYDTGYNDGYNIGEKVGFADGYSLGLADGFEEGFNADSTAITIFNGILSIGMLPINVFLAILNFDILGINVANFVSALLSICITLIVVRVILGTNKGD